MIRRFVIATLLLFAAFRADAGFYSDTWFRADQAGYGFTVTQTDNFMFVTFFIYGPDGKPYWYVANLDRQPDGSFKGDVFETRGTFFGSPWNPNNFTANTAGTATFTPSSSNAYQATFTYSVNVASSAKALATSTVAIERQTLTDQDLRGEYAGGQRGGYSSCDNPDVNGGYADHYFLTITQDNPGQVTMQFDFLPRQSGQLSCTLSGNLIHNGQLYRIPNATYTCNDGTDTIASLSQIKSTSQGIEGVGVAAVGDGCVESFRFSAVYL